jgi:hypothetical protein
VRLAGAAGADLDHLFRGAAASFYALKDDHDE